MKKIGDMKTLRGNAEDGSIKELAEEITQGKIKDKKVAKDADYYSTALEGFEKSLRKAPGFNGCIVIVDTYFGGVTASFMQKGAEFNEDFYTSSCASILADIHHKLGSWREVALKDKELNKSLRKAYKKLSPQKRKEISFEDFSKKMLDLADTLSDVIGDKL